MSTEMSAFSWLFEATRIANLRDRLTTGRNRRPVFGFGRFVRLKRGHPPPGLQAEELSAHLRRDIGLDRSRL